LPILAGGLRFNLPIRPKQGQKKKKKLYIETQMKQLQRELKKENPIGFRKRYLYINAGNLFAIEI